MKSSVRNVLARWALGFLVISMVIAINGLVCTACNRDSEVNRSMREFDAHGRLQHGYLCAATAACQPAALWDGPLGPEIVKTIWAELRDRDAAAIAPPSERWLCLRSAGGNTRAAADFAKWLRRGGWNTCVVPVDRGDADGRQPSSCSSACSEVWLGGVVRVLSGDQSYVGFHGAFVEASPWCAPANATAAFFAAPALQFCQGVAMGEIATRLQLSFRASSYGPTDTYRLTPTEAVGLSLQNPAVLRTDWTWRSTPSYR